MLDYQSEYYLAAQATPRDYPNLPNDWQAQMSSLVEIVQGDGAYNTNTAVCCPLKSDGCQIQVGTAFFHSGAIRHTTTTHPLQVAYDAGMWYFDFTNQRTASIAPDGSVSTTHIHTLLRASLVSSVLVNTVCVCRALCRCTAPR
jgi:hypothetical protein